MRQTSEATAVAPNEIFTLLSKTTQLNNNLAITQHLHDFYSSNNMLSILNTLTDAHSALLVVNNTKISKTTDDNIHKLVNFVSALTHFQILKK